MRIIIFLLVVNTGIAAAQPSLIGPFKNRTKTNLTSFLSDQSYGSPDRESKKSVPLAIMYSLLLPGMGELYAGDYGTGKYLTAAEGMLWLTLIGFDRYGTWLQNDARSFAAQHAEVNLEGKNDRFFVDIGNYNTVYEYNEQMLRDRNLLKLYNENSSYSWNWDNRANREYYRDLRIKSDNMFNSVNFVIAAIAVNHVVSAINAARIAISQNKRNEEANLIDIKAYVLGGAANPHGILISFSKSF